MTDFQKKLINKLLDQFERSQQSWKAGTKARVVRLSVEKDSLFKNYAHSSTSYLYRPDIDKDVSELEFTNVVIVKKDKQTGLLKTIDLNIEEVDKAYFLVKRTPLNDLLYDEEEFVNSQLSKYSDSLVIKRYLSHILELIQNHKSRKKYYVDIEELKTDIEMIYAIEKQNEDIFLRVFSKKRFGDSKAVERNSSKVFQIFNEFGDLEYDNIVDLFEEHNIVKNKGNAIAKQGMSFEINNQIIDLDKFGEEFYFSMNMLMKMSIVSIRKNRIITIENLTTFYSFKDDNAVILYLGGFHNSAKRALIKKICDFNPNLEFYHSGDIDCGGFEILIDLREKTGIYFKPLLMGVAQIEKYKDECQTLTDNDIKRLEMLLTRDDALEFKEVIEYMLKNSIKLEQESIDDKDADL